jgi:hypothetical protein
MESSIKIKKILKDPVSTGCVCLSVLKQFIYNLVK